MVKSVLSPLTGEGHLEALPQWLEEASDQAAVDRYIVGPTLKLVSEEGAFGLPYFKVQKERDSAPRYFFGCDRLENMAHYLQLPYENSFVKSRESSPKL